jgi:hypothetical protein
VLLRDRIHLVNRYERLRAVDPEQGKRKRVSIHERLRLIAYRINEVLNRLGRYTRVQAAILPSISMCQLIHPMSIHSFYSCCFFVVVVVVYSFVSRRFDF